MEMIKRFFKDEEGATAVEYGIMVAAIAAAIIAVVFSIGTEVNQEFTTIETKLKE
jgi:pilus assembly protein Flp/PilA